MARLIGLPLASHWYVYVGAVTGQAPGDAVTFKPTLTVPLMPGAFMPAKFPLTDLVEWPLPAVTV